MGTTMVNPECEWVRVRLPLWVGVRQDRTEPIGEAGDLSPEDHRSIERHLESCPGCARHRAGLERALNTLGLVAGSPPSSPEGPSLWPALERKMTARQVRNRPRWLRPLHEASDRGLRAWVDFQVDRPLRLAWMRDSLGEVLKGAGWGESTDRGRESRRRWVRRPAGVIGTGVAATVLVWIGLMGTRRQEESARLAIRANAQPVPGAVVPPMPVESAASAPANSADDAPNAPSDLVQADPIAVLEAPPAESSPSPKAATATAAAKAMPAPPPSLSRWNYDLENGTPMPPHAREAKPVY